MSNGRWLRVLHPILYAMAWLLGSSASAAAQAQDPGLARLEAELGRLSAIARGKVGVGIVHLETGRELYLNPDEPFPMASTFKVPVAVQLFSLVATFLVGGFGLFYFLSKTDQGGLITLLAAIAWCVLFAWLWAKTRPRDD